jgi:hypothetical protein
VSSASAREVVHGRWHGQPLAAGRADSDHRTGDRCAVHCAHDQPEKPPRRSTADLTRRGRPLWIGKFMIARDGRWLNTRLRSSKRNRPAVNALPSHLPHEEPGE